MNNKTKHLLVLAAVAVMVGFSTHNASAQGQGNFDPVAFRQNRIDGYRDRIEVKNEEDWKKIEPLIAKVVDARDAAPWLRGGGFGGGFGGRGGRGGGAAGGADAAAGGARGGANRFGPAPSPEQEALQKAIDDKAPADEVKEKLAKLRESRKAKEAALDKAQEELRKALTPRQEAGAVLASLLK